MLLLAGASIFSLRLLLRAGELAGTSCAQNYEGIGELALGSKGKHLVEFIFCCGGFGLTMAYFIYIGQLV